MLFSTDEIESFTEQWSVIEEFCSTSHRQWMAGGILINETPPESFYNLPVVLAFSLLDEVLGSLAEQGVFVLRGTMLGAKMHASRVTVPWRDYDLVVAHKDRRNDLAHEGKLIPKLDCLTMVDAIGDELRAWGAIAAA